MLPTIQNGQRLKTIRLDAQSRAKLSRGDIIAFLFPEDTSKFYIKRVIALPGETVEIRKAEVWVNGLKLSEPYVAPKFNMSSRSYVPNSACTFVLRVGRQSRQLQRFSVLGLRSRRIDLC
jgi:signal peptidase I